MNSHNISFAEYGVSFQEKIMQALLVDHKWAEQMSEVIRIEYFDLKYLKYLSEKYFHYYQKYKTFPTIQLLISIVRDDLKMGTDVILRDKIVEFIRRIKTNPDVGDQQYVKEKSLDFCKKQAMKEALEKAVDMISNGEDENDLNVIRSALTVGTPASVGHDFFEDIEARLVTLSRCACPTGIEQLDAKNILNGGLSRGELGVIVAPTGVGKSHFLVQLGAHALKLGKNVIHYTFELTETAVGIRYDSNLCGISSNDIVERKKDVKKQYETMNLGRLFIKEYPTSSASVITLRSHLEKLLLRGFKPSLILIDYADIMRSTRKFDSLRHELKLIYEELRNLASESSIPIWTASQANRSAAQSDIVGLENMSEAYGKAMVADIVLSISRKPHEKSSGVGRLFIAKNRAGRDGLVFPIEIDTERSEIHILQNAEAQSLEDHRQQNESTMKLLLQEKWREVSTKRKIQLQEE